jgi:hypothetical protein
VFTDERIDVRLQKTQGTADFYEGQFASRFPVMNCADASTRLPGDVAIAD